MSGKININVNLGDISITGWILIIGFIFALFGWLFNISSMQSFGVLLIIIIVAIYLGSFILEYME